MDSDKAESAIRKAAALSARDVPRPGDAPAKLTMDPCRATTFRDPKTGRRHSFNSEVAQKCRKTF